MIRPAKEEELPSVQQLYWDITDSPGESQIGWIKGIYPSDELLVSSIARSELYVQEERGHIIAAMILNTEGNESYAKADWGVNAAPGEALVLHALGVCPSHQHEGRAKAMVREAVRLSRKRKMKAVRLDVLAGNKPAAALYENEGFQFRGPLEMYYEDTGWTEFLMYELALDYSWKSYARELFLIPVYLYKGLISPFTGPCCRYTPSCSTYFLGCVKRFGIVKGSIMGTARLLRCSKRFLGGPDPVPSAWSWKRIVNDWKAYRIRRK